MLFLCIDLAERAEKDASFRTSAKSQDRPKVVHGVDHEQLLSGINGHGYSQRRKALKFILLAVRAQGKLLRGYQASDSTH